jgi:hypothetical protein
MVRVEKKLTQGSAMLSKIHLLMLASLVTLPGTSFASWIKTLDCKDAHGNQLVIDVNSEDSAEFQMVVRSSPSRSTSAIQFFFDQSLAYSTAVAPRELVIPGSAHSRSIFVASDEYLSHEVRDARNGVTLIVSKGPQTAHWNFPYCQRSL